MLDTFQIPVHTKIKAWSFFVIYVSYLKAVQFHGLESLWKNIFTYFPKLISVLPRIHHLL